jgi:hypothetical protein
VRAVIDVVVRPIFGGPAGAFLFCPRHFLL